MTIELDNDERRTIAAHHGEPGLASRDTIREWAKHVIRGELEVMFVAED